MPCEYYLEWWKVDTNHHQQVQAKLIYTFKYMWKALQVLYSFVRARHMINNLVSRELQAAVNGIDYWLAAATDLVQTGAVDTERSQHDWEPFKKGFWRLQRHLPRQGLGEGAREKPQVSHRHRHLLGRLSAHISAWCRCFYNSFWICCWPIFLRKNPKDKSFLIRCLSTLSLWRRTILVCSSQKMAPRPRPPMIRW